MRGEVEREEEARVRERRAGDAATCRRCRRREADRREEADDDEVQRARGCGSSGSAQQAPRRAALRRPRAARASSGRAARVPRELIGCGCATACASGEPGSTNTSSTSSGGTTIVSTVGSGMPLERVLVAPARPCARCRRRRRRSRRRSTVMLSSPPPRFAAETSDFVARSRSSRCVSTTSRMSSSSTMSVRPSEQRRKTSPSPRLDRERVDVDVGVGADRARDHRALRMRLGLLARELAALQQLVHERVILGQLLELAAADEVGARVADVPDRHLARPRRARRSSSSPCPTSAGSLVRALVDAAVRLLDQRRHLLRRRTRARIGLLERRGGELRGDLARLRAAHAVGDGEERRRDDVRVLVPAPLLARVARARVRRRRSLPRTSARSRRRARRRRSTSLRGRSMRTPFTNVPFVEPRSCTQTPSRRGSMRTCRADANSSPSITRRSARRARS